MLSNFRLRIIRRAAACSIEDTVELPQVNAIHTSKDCVTVVYAAGDQSVDQGNCSVSRQCSSDRTYGIAASDCGISVR